MTENTNPDSPQQKNESADRGESPDLDRAVKELDIRISSSGSPLRVEKSSIYLAVFIGLFLFLTLLFYFGTVRPIELNRHDSPRRVDMPRLGISVVPPQGYTRNPDILPRFDGPDNSYLEVAARNVQSYPQPKGKENAGIFTCVLFGRSVAERYEGDVIDAVPLRVGKEYHGGFAHIRVDEGEMSATEVFAYGIVIDEFVYEAVFVYPEGNDSLERYVMDNTAASLKAAPYVMPTAKPVKPDSDNPHQPEGQ